MATRLGNALLKLAAEHPEKADEITYKVKLLDRAIEATSRKGAGIRMLGAWKTCLVLFKDVTGKPWKA